MILMMMMMKRKERIARCRQQEAPVAGSLVWPIRARRQHGEVQKQRLREVGDRPGARRAWGYLRPRRRPGRAGDKHRKHRPRRGGGRDGVEIMRLGMMVRRAGGRALTVSEEVSGDGHRGRLRRGQRALLHLGGGGEAVYVVRV